MNIGIYQNQSEKEALGIVRVEELMSTNSEEIKSKEDQIIKSLNFEEAIKPEVAKIL